MSNVTLTIVILFAEDFESRDSLSLALRRKSKRVDFFDSWQFENDFIGFLIPAKFHAKKTPTKMNFVEKKKFLT